MDKFLLTNIHKNLKYIKLQESRLELLRLPLYLIINGTIISCISFIVLQVLLYFYNLNAAEKEYSNIVFSLIIICIYGINISISISYLRTALVERKRLKTVLINSKFAENWKVEYLRSDQITLFNLLYARVHNFLDDDEFEIKKDLLLELNIKFTFVEFITILELKDELKVTDNQLIKIKNNFINDQESLVKTNQLHKLLELKIITYQDVIKKQRIWRKYYLRFVAKQILLSVSIGIFSFLLGYSGLLTTHFKH